MEGIATPELLIQGAQSEHSYALKPSDAEKIGRAQFIFEIGPDLETYLTRPILALSPKAVVVVLARSAGVHVLPARRGGLWESAEDPDEGPSDPHIWLDPQNAIAMTRTIALVLSRADPSHGKLYSANRDREISMLAHLEVSLRGRLAPLSGSPYLVFHDAYQYFERRFDLHPVGAVTVAPDRPVGPRRIEALRNAIVQRGIVCIFREPQFTPRLVDTLVSGSAARIGVLDPLGATIAPGAELYPRLLTSLSASLTSCMAPSRKKR
jgi:zinc transport system substrate-binding protein